MINVFSISPDLTMDHLGLIPGFLDEEDPRPAREQFDDNYQHGGGWRPFQGFVVVQHMLHYEDEEPLVPLAMIAFRDEKIFIYQSAWVMIMQPDGSHSIARMD